MSANPPVTGTALRQPDAASSKVSCKLDRREPFDADAFLLKIAPYLMGFLLLFCMGSVVYAGVSATPPVFAHSNMKPGDNHMMNTAEVVLAWVSQSTDSVAVVTRTVLTAFAGN